MLFFGVFLRETARPVAKSRTNLAQIQEKLPNGWTDWHQIWHTCANSSGNGHMLNKVNLTTQVGISESFRRSQIQKSGRLLNGWTDWHHIWYTSADSSGNGHRLNTFRPSILGGGGGGRGSQIKKSGEDSNGWSDWHQMCRFIWEWIYAKQIAPRDTGGGHLGGLGGQTIKGQGKLSNGWTDWHQLWFTSADSSGNGYRLNKSRPSIPQGACRGGGGGVRGSQIQKSWEAAKRLDRFAPNLYTSVDSSGMDIG